MDYKNQSEEFLRKILARDSYLEYSSPVYYCNSGEGVPFKWEMQPGIAKDYQPNEELPPLGPPPAVLSSGLPKPCIELIEPKASTRSRLLYFFWKKSTRSGKGNNKLKEEFKEYSSDDVNNGFVVSARLECSSDSESMASPGNSNSSSSSSSSLTKDRPNSLWLTKSASTRREISGRPLGCIPVNIGRILVPTGRRD